MIPSTFGWIDFAEQDRRKMADMIRLFRERDTRDELGLGSVRDALANLLFPGTSTVQTRAKYMLFVPWIYLKHEKQQTSSQDIGRKARNDELAPGGDRFRCQGDETLGRGPLQAGRVGVDEVQCTLSMARSALHSSRWKLFLP